MIIWNSKMETKDGSSVQFSSVQSLSRVRLFVTPWTAACQSSLFFTISQSLLKLMLVMPCNHLILCHPLLLLPSIVPSTGVFSNESALCIRWPKYWRREWQENSANVQNEVPYWSSQIINTPLDL